MQEVRGKHWDEYWVDSAHDRGAFAIIAKFYRRYIISPAVKHYFHKYFTDQLGRVYLHAGCGSGESDNRIQFRDATFVLMDISPKALAIAREKSRFTNVRFVCGDIYRPPFKPASLDGLWNLGVMEHFYEDEIARIFQALAGVLKPGGKCLVFWPPKYGLSVIVLTSFLYIVNKFRKRPMVLYPDEVSRFSSPSWVEGLLGPAGFAVQKTHFGIRDLFTYVVLVAAKSAGGSKNS